MSPALNGSSAIQRFERGNVIELRNGITYTGLPHMGSTSNAYGEELQLESAVRNDEV